jgi:hypothetical protein
METENKRGGLKTYQAFTPPSPYEQERRKAEQMRRYAELLQEQAMAEDEPFTYQGFRAMPSPAAALGKLLKAYGSKKAGEKADEAEARKAGMEQQASQQIMGRLTGGAPVSMVDTTPDESGLAEVAVQSQYRQDPTDAMRLAATPQGVGAMKGNPMLAAMLQRSMETPKETAPMVTGGMYRDPKTGQWNEIPGYTNQQQAIAAARRPDVASKDERLVAILGADGKPTYVRESQAVGKTPFTAKTLAQETAEAAAAQANAQREIDTQSALDNISELIAHPGRKAATGKSSFVSMVPGTDAYDFAAKLDTFKAKTFIPMVSALKGMGALSDAEGKRLQAAVGALDPSMSEEAFVKELEEVAKTLVKKAEVAGLKVTLPVNMGGVPEGFELE